jgi:hypothetical protein
LGKLYFVIEGEMKNFYNGQKLKECMTTKPALQKILKRILHTDKVKLSHENARKNKFH